MRNREGSGALRMKEGEGRVGEGDGGSEVWFTTVLRIMDGNCPLGLFYKTYRIKSLQSQTDRRQP